MSGLQLADSHVVADLSMKERRGVAEAQGYDDNTPATGAACVEDIIARTAHACLTPYQPCLVLEDYKEPNFNPLILSKKEIGNDPNR